MRRAGAAALIVSALLGAALALAPGGVAAATGATAAREVPSALASEECTASTWISDAPPAFIVVNWWRHRIAALRSNLR